VIDFARGEPHETEALMRRLLGILPHLGVCTVGRAGYHAGLGKFDTRKAAAGLSRAGLVFATIDGRLTLTMHPRTLLELTEAGRRAQLEMVGQQ
jgi:hypothetical protein